jgi:hypothetical protein
MAINLGTPQIIGIGLLGGAAYFYFNPRAFTALMEGFGASPATADNLTRQAGLPVATRTPTFAGSLASGAAAGSAAGPIGAGIGAAATAIAYGVIELGWGRGGWEGAKGNTIRDRFLDQFVQIYYPGGGTEHQFEAMEKALASIGIVGSGEPGSSTPNAGEMIKRIYDPNTADEMRAAISAWASLFKQRANITLIVPPDSAY